MIDNVNVSQFNVMKEFRLLNMVKCRIREIEYHRSVLDRLGYVYDRVVVNRDLSKLKLLETRLVCFSVICNRQRYKRLFKCFKRFPSKVSDHCISLFGTFFKRTNSLVNNLKRLECLPETDDLKALIEKERFVVERMAEFQKDLKDRCCEARKAELLSRLALEVLYHKDWFVVFNTLTVENSMLSKVFSPSATAWTDYIRLVDRQIGIKCHGSWRAAVAARRKGDDFHRYFAVVEEGGETGRLHIHCLHFLKDLPYGSFDPNRSVKYALRHELLSFKPYWKFGFSTPIMFRTNNNDAWGKADYRWLDVKDENGDIVPMPMGDCMKIAYYMVKYLTKTYQQERKDYIWRVRTTRRLGLEILEEIIQSPKVTNKMLLCLMRYESKMHLKIMRQELPTMTLRLLATKEAARRMKVDIPSVFWEMLLEMAYDTQESFWKRVVNIVRMNPECRELSCGDTEILSLWKMVGSDIVSLVEEVASKYSYDFNKIDVNGIGVQLC